MDNIIKKILNTIEKNGFEAYLVGGFVRDYLLGIKTTDVDICTNALPKDLHKIFPNNTNSNNYGGFNLKIKNFNIDITTYRKEVKYDNRKPSEIIYLNNLAEDIERRDFTINSICMNKYDKIIDLKNGIKDLNNQTIRMFDNVDKRLKEDPLRILRAIRFATILDFNIDNELDKGIKNNYKLVKTLSIMRIKQEFNKILLNPNFLKGLELLKKYNILNLLDISYEDVVYVEDLCGMWAQLKFSNDYLFTKQEKINIINIRQIIEYGKIDNNILYKYGLYNCLVAGEILNINKKLIHYMYRHLAIKSEEDLKISNRQIIDILKIKPSKKIRDLKQELIKKILSNKLKNNHHAIVNYIISRKE